MSVLFGSVSQSLRSIIIDPKPTDNILRREQMDAGTKKPKKGPEVDTAIRTRDDSSTNHSGSKVKMRPELGAGEGAS